MFTVGNYRYFLCPEDVIQPEELPEGWGLLWIKGKRIKVIVEIDRTMHKGLINEYRHETNPLLDRGLLYSMARRIKQEY